VTEVTKQTSNLQVVSQNLFQAAERWRIGGTIFQVGLFSVGLWSIWFTLEEIWPTLFMILFTISYEITLLKSNNLYGQAQNLRRTLDLNEAFGWKPSDNEIRDVSARVPKILLQGDLLGRKGSYFASTDTSGSQKALKNLSESCWWSKVLCEKLFTMYSFIVSGILLVSFIGLISILVVAEDYKTRLGVSEAITLVILLIFTLNILRRLLAYRSFAKDAETIEKSAYNLLERNENDSITALRLWSEYQVLRNSAPPIPGWFWRLHQEKLNAAYKVESAS
jgi:hypothetical protein